MNRRTQVSEPTVFGAAMVAASSPGLFHPLKAAASCGESLGSEIKSLASSALDLNQLIKLAKLSAKHFQRANHFIC
jgi:alpha-D-ribose 1-methylphosphonate 5-triphosphate synthase subunit PhnH